MEEDDDDDDDFVSASNNFLLLQIFDISQAIKDIYFIFFNTF